ncbi:Histidinol-phosphate phosphatase [Planctomycetales bacterium 10988]|nr:Histidinol-phosphate phosphatase [Planctomycetales bacterium 10988]
MNDAYQARLEVALAAGQEAGQITLHYFQQKSLVVETKDDQSPVTIADREAEQFLRKEILKAFPEDGILGEEFPEHEGSSGYRWILDPIDGTKSFIYGVPLYGTMIGIEKDGDRSVVGVVDHAPLGETVYAADGMGAWLIRKGQAAIPAKVSEVSTLVESLFVSTSPPSYYQFNREAVWQALMKQSKYTRTWGDCYGYTLVATGRAEVMLDPAMNLWDNAALQPILEGAGGTFTDWNGKPTIHTGEGLATNGKIFEEVLALTQGK